MDTIKLYYVSSPSLNVDALVEAPDTYQARTQLLDYMEREGIIERNQRSLYRKQILTKKVDPSSNITSPIYLPYIPGEPRFSPSVTDLSQISVDNAEVPMPEEAVQEVQPKPILTPLARVALTGKL